MWSGSHQAEKPTDSPDYLPSAIDDINTAANSGITCSNKCWGWDWGAGNYSMVLSANNLALYYDLTGAKRGR